MQKVKIQKGFFVPALPYVSILLDETIGFSLRMLGFEELGEEFKIQIPHPANYVFHKLLVAERRGREQKKEKDWANVFETAIMTRGIWDEMRDKFKSFDEPNRFPVAWIGDARRLAHKRFGDRFSDGPVAVTRLVTNVGYQMSEAGVSKLMNQFFNKLGWFGAR